MKLFHHQRMECNHMEDNDEAAAKADAEDIGHETVSHMVRNRQHQEAR